jgi:hypothetical protein
MREDHRGVEAAAAAGGGAEGIKADHVGHVVLLAAERVTVQSGGLSDDSLYSASNLASISQTGAVLGGGVGLDRAFGWCVGVGWLAGGRASRRARAATFGFA